MKKHDLLKDGNNIIRVLEIQPDKILMIDCIKRTMPIWVESSALDAFSACTDEILSQTTNFAVIDIENLNADQKRTMYDRYTLIAPILPFIADERMRSKVIGSIAIEHNISKQTIRNYLCLYLAYMNITVLASRKRLDDDGNLTQDEKNIRWALNKFFYTTKKQSLMTAYTMMLKEKYCDSMSVLRDPYPSFYQFRYFYRKTKKLQNFYISRDGLKSYQRNNRPLIGDGIQSFAPAIGVGMLDSTVCDIYLINDAGNLVGRPILTACIDAYSGLCCGYVLSWAGGVYSLRGLMLNIIADKAAWCKQFGISMNAEAWSCDKLPATMVTDMGSEYKSENFEQIAELGVKVINLPSYRPELKGMVEKFFDVVQSTYKKHLKGKGVIEPDYQERGVHDYRKDACMTMTDFERIILHCIIYYNSQRTLEKFPYTNESDALNDSYLELFELIGKDAMLKLFKHFRGDKIDCPMRLYSPEFIADLAKQVADRRERAKFARAGGYSVKVIEGILNKRRKKMKMSKKKDFIQSWTKYNNIRLGGIFKKIKRKPESEFVASEANTPYFLCAMIMIELMN